MEMPGQPAQERVACGISRPSDSNGGDPEGVGAPSQRLGP